MYNYDAGEPISNGHKRAPVGYHDNDGYIYNSQHINTATPYVYAGGSIKQCCGPSLRLSVCLSACLFLLSTLKTFLIQAVMTGHHLLTSSS